MPLTQMLFSFRGRINRSDWWAFGIMSNMMWIWLGVVGMVIQDNLHSIPDSIAPLVGIFLFIVMPLGMLLTLYIDLALTVKRVHDTNNSAWLVLPGILIPIVGWIGLWCTCAFQAGTKGDNKYGLPPKQGNIHNENV